MNGLIGPMASTKCVTFPASTGSLKFAHDASQIIMLTRRTIICCRCCCFNYGNKNIDNAIETDTAEYGSNKTFHSTEIR